ncbi:MAG: DUF4417 domain-containing protein [Christensenellales bacterium]
MSYRDYTDIFNFKLLKNIKLTKSGFPIVQGTDYVPTKLIPFNYAATIKDKQNTSVHFYIDDYQFERVWNKPTMYAQILSGFDCVIGPDFSLYANFPKPLQMFNLYKQRLLTAYWQSLGIKVIPNVCWSTLEDLELCLDGLPKYSVVSLSTNGCLNEETKKSFLECFNKMEEILKPLKILIIGNIPEELKHKNNIIQFNSFSKRFENLKQRSKI